MAKRISVINFKGGVGKTTLAFHLGTGLARYHNARVLLIDIDHQSSLSILCLGASKWEITVNSGRIINKIFQHMTIPGSLLPGDEIVSKNPMSDDNYRRLDLVPASLQLDDIEIQLASTQMGSPFYSEWTKRTLLCQWLESTGLDALYDYIIIDCPPATKIVTQNAIALSHGYVVPVVPEAVMIRGTPHLISMISSIIDQMLQSLASSPQVTPKALHVMTTALVGVVVTRIRTHPRAKSGYTNDHTEHLVALQNQFGNNLVTPYIEDGTGVTESLTAGQPVFDREYTQNVGNRGFGDTYRMLVSSIKARMDAI